MADDERIFYVALREYLEEGFALAKRQGNQGRALGFVMTIFQKIAASSFAAVRRTLRRRLMMLTLHEAILKDQELDIDARNRLYDEARELIAEGDFAAVKIRVGRETADQDIAVIRAVRAAVGEDVLLPCDFNQSLDVEEAIRRGRAFDTEGLYWIEEPIPYDDLHGNAEVAAAIETPVSIGENFFGPRAMQDAIAAKAGDYMMPDAGRIGGVTGWRRAAKLAQDSGIEMSTHIYPEISAHLMAVTPTRHWLEFVDWASPILAQPSVIAGGALTPANEPGTGIAWNEDAVAQYATPL